MIQAGVMGATGYAGAELVRVLANHPEFQLHSATSNADAGMRIADVYPSFQGVCDDVVLERHDCASLLECDVAFLAVPHTAGMTHAARLHAAGVSVVDLSADFRFTRASDYEAVYNVEHTAADLLADAAYGQPETERDALARLAQMRAEGNAVVVGCAGCYPTASILAATPALAAGVVNAEAPIVVDAISGVSGAGRKPTARTHFCGADEAVEPYGLPHHRHAPEIAQAFARAQLRGAGQATPAANLPAGTPTPAAHVVFTPHLAPLKRGLLSTVYLPLSRDVSDEELRGIYEAAYAESPLVSVLPAGAWPKTSSVAGTARAHVNVVVNAEEHMAIAICAIDNLGKGAADQAVQCANLLFGLDEAAGLANVAYAS